MAISSDTVCLTPEPDLKYLYSPQNVKFTDRIEEVNTRKDAAVELKSIKLKPFKFDSGL